MTTVFDVIVMFVPRDQWWRGASSLASQRHSVALLRRDVIARSTTRQDVRWN